MNALTLTQERLHDLSSSGPIRGSNLAEDFWWRPVAGEIVGIFDELPVQRAAMFGMVPFPLGKQLNAKVAQDSIELRLFSNELVRAWVPVFKGALAAMPNPRTRYGVIHPILQTGSPTKSLQDSAGHEKAALQQPSQRVYA